MADLTIDVSVEVECEECKETHLFNYDGFNLRRDSIHSSDEEEVLCKCGSVIEVKTYYDMSVSTTHTPPPSLEEFEDTPPGPNQINLFTNKTLVESI